MKSRDGTLKIKQIVIVIFIIFSFYTQSQITKSNIDSINCYILSDEMASYEHELTVSEVKDFALYDGSFFHLDTKNANCLDSFSRIDFSETKNEIYKPRKNMSTKLLIEVYLSNGIVNTIEMDCLYFYRVNKSDTIYSMNLGILLWMDQYLGVKIFSYWCVRLKIK